MLRRGLIVLASTVQEMMTLQHYNEIAMNRPLKMPLQAVHNGLPAGVNPALQVL